MEHSRFTDEQLIGLLKRVEDRVPVKDLSHKHGYSDAMYYRWHSRLGGPDASEIRHLRELESENTKRKKLLAEAMRARTQISERRSFALIGL